MSFQEKVASVLNTVIRPAVQRDRGDVRLVEADESTGIVKIEFQGMCVGCPMSTLTLKAGVEAALMDEIPEVRGVMAINPGMEDAEMMDIFEGDEEDAHAKPA